MVAALVVGSGLASAAHVVRPSGRAPLAAAASAIRNNGVSPPPTEYASAAFDAVDGYALMFGGAGASGATVATTWIFAHGNWSELNPVSGVAPPARFQAQMTYDAGDGQIVLFGGCADRACQHLLNDTWTFVHGQWTNVSSLSGTDPPARDRGMMTYDAADGYVLLFGGEQPTQSAFLQDTWSFHADRWSRIDLSGAFAPPPSPRMGSLAIYDPARNATVLFGGAGASGVLGDTWEFRAGNWSSVGQDFPAAPGARWAASGAYDSEDGYPLMVNGYNGGHFISEVWAFGGGTWNELADAGGPDASFGGVLVDDPTDAYMVYFSGVVAGYALLTATLVYQHGGWLVLINPPGSTNFPLLTLVLSSVFLPILLAITWPITNRIRRHREAQLAHGVNLAPGEIVRWVETPNPWRTNAAQIVAVAVLLAIPLVFLLPAALGGVSFGGSMVILAIGGGSYGIAALVVTRSLSRTLTRAIGVIASGVIVRRSSDELRVGWENLQPSLTRPQKDRYLFQFLFPGKESAQGGFVVTVVQARAILTDPHAPAWILARPVSEGLGLPPRAIAPVAPAPLPTAGAPRRPGGYGTAPPPTIGLPPSYSPGAWSAPPPPWQPPPPPVTRPAPPRPVAPLPPAGTTPCPRCGQLNPTGRVVFCRSCGQRLQ